jgi:PAS domain-containing protein
MKMTKAQIERKLSELAALRKIVIAINSQIGDLDAVVHLILTSVCELIGARHGSLMLIHSGSNSLHIAAVVGDDWTLEKKACTLALGEGITGRTAVTGQAYLCHDVSKDSHYFPLFDYIVSELAVPVVSQGRVLGVINVDSERMEAFTTADLDLVAMLADHAAIAIENARQFQLARSDRERWLQLFNMLPDGVLLCDATGNVERANAHFTKLFNLAPDQVLGCSVDVVLRPFLSSGLENGWESLLRDGQALNAVFVVNQRRIRIVYSQPFLMGDKTAILLCMRESESAGAAKP